MDSSQLSTRAFFFIGLLILSVFFSGSETAFFSLGKSQLRSLRVRKDSLASRVIRLLDRPRDLLVAILIGNTLVNIAAASLAAVTVHELSVAAGFNTTIALILDIVAVTFILIVFVEITPKVFAFKHNERWATALSAPVKLATFIFWPLTRLMVVFAEALAKAIGVEAKRVLFSEEELRTLAEVGEEHGVLEEEEREMIHSIFEFGETEVREVMVPRIDVVSISEQATIEEAAGLIHEKGHSRIPVYSQDIDHILGILYAKDLIGRETNDLKIKDLVREAYFVPESKRISSLLREFQEHKVHIAIVVDEYGGTEGLATLEDVIEEIVGEIQDEFDQEEELSRRLENGDYYVLAKLEVSEFNRLVGEDIVPQDGDFETLGGFIFSLAGEVPLPDQKFEHEGWTFTVTGVDGNRLVSLNVRPPQDAATPEDDGERDRPDTDGESVGR